MSSLKVYLFFSGNVGVDKGAVEITNCFCVPHNESKEEVSLTFL